MGKYKGALAEVRPDDLAAHRFTDDERRANVPPDAIDEVVLGAANQAGEDNRNVARMAAPSTTSSIASGVRSRGARRR